MARYRGPSLRLARREKVDLMHKSGIRTIQQKCRFDSVPGQHGAKRSRLSDYGTQLRMKQMIKRYYGMLEKQFRRFYEKADMQKGSTGDNLLRLLERRFDNVVYRLGFAATRAEARQLVSHKALMINGYVVNIPSYEMKEGDIISVREKAKSQNRIKAALELSDSREAISWVSVDKTAMSGTVNAQPDLSELPADFLVNLVVEFYSK